MKLVCQTTAMEVQWRWHPFQRVWVGSLWCRTHSVEQQVYSLRERYLRTHGMTEDEAHCFTQAHIPYKWLFVEEFLHGLEIPDVYRAAVKQYLPDLSRYLE